MGVAPPAWSAPFAAESLRTLSAAGPLAAVTRAWAWGGSTGQGVRVAVVDSGIDADHPALAGCVRGGVVVNFDPAAAPPCSLEEERAPSDVFGHGTACAGIIHDLASAAELYSVRVLGRDLTGKALQFARGLRWALDNGMDVVNLSLSTSRQEYYGLFHELADEAYFRGVVLVCAANNLPAPSYPSLYAAVLSVAAHAGQDPFTYYYNPAPPVEFGAPGIDLRVAWLDGGYIVATGNSFAAPHIAGLAALVRGKHPELTPFQLKTVLFACASNVAAAQGEVRR